MKVEALPVLNHCLSQQGVERMLICIERGAGWGHFCKLHKDQAWMSKSDMAAVTRTELRTWQGPAPARCGHQRQCCQQAKQM